MEVTRNEEQQLRSDILSQGDRWATRKKEEERWKAKEIRTTENTIMGKLTCGCLNVIIHTKCSDLTVTTPAQLELLKKSHLPTLPPTMSGKYI